MLQKIVPKTIAMQAYLVTTVVVTVLMAVIGYLYADATRQHIFLSQERKLLEIVTILDQRLNSTGLMSRYEQASNATDETTLQATSASLQSIVEDVGQQYPDIAMGYSLPDRRLAAYPYHSEFFMSSAPADIEDAYRAMKPHVSTSLESPYWNEPSMKITYPILKDGEILGHVWSSVPMTRVKSAVYFAWLLIFFILFLAWLSLIFVLNKVFTDIFKTLAEVAEKIARQDDNIDIEKVPQLQSVLTAATTLRNSLQEKETAYRTLVENAPDNIARHDMMGQIIYANPVLTERFNLNHSYAVGDKVFSRNEFIQYENELARNVAATGSSVTFEYERQLPCGKKRYLKCVMQPERDESGQVVSVLSLSRDITDIKESSALFLAAFNLSPNGMSVTRQTDHTLIQVNDTFVQLSGLSAHTVVGRTTAELAMWVNNDHFEEFYKLLLQQGYVTNYEVQYIAASGRIRTGLVSSREITINGEPCWLIVTTDITEKKRLDAEMARLDALNLVGEMAASIGHEVRNPMTTVRGYLQLFQRKAEFQPYNDRLVTMIEEIDRANAIITEFLSLAKNKSTKLEQGNLNTVVETLSPLMQADALRMGQQLEVISSAIPDTIFDDSEIRQLILNLFRNAMDAMDLFGVARIRTYATDDAVVLEVSDTGKGIPPEIMDKLGTPFFTTKENGTGLGLAVCYRVAQRHRATIDIDSSPAGTTVSIRFKLVKAA